MQEKGIDKHALLKFLSTTILVFISLVIVFVFYFAVIDANPPIELTSDVTISPKSAVAGDTVVMTNSYCKNTDVASHLSAFWQRDDGLIWELKVKNMSISRNGCFTVSVPLVIPDGMPSGMWQRVNIAEYHVNPLATRTVTWRSEFIEISNR